jgi:DNA-binding XRE family transcriptional regulator
MKMKLRRAVIDPVTNERVMENRERTVRTEFGLWMNQRMASGMTHAEVAKKLHISRSSVTGHATGRVKPTFMNVIAYCWAFGGEDDPEKIWNLVDREIEP